MKEKVNQSEDLKANKKSARKKKNTGVIGLKIILIALVVSFLFAGMTFGYYFGYKIFADTGGVGNGVQAEITVEEGDSVGAVADKLYDSGLINDKLVFIVQSYFYSYKIIPGTYILDDSMTNEEIFIQLEGGGL